AGGSSRTAPQRRFDGTGATLTGVTTHLEAPPANAPTIAIDGIPVLDVSAREAFGLCADAVLSRRGARVATVNLDFLALARRDRGLHRLLPECSLLVADGMPGAWLGSLARARPPR